MEIRRHPRNPEEKGGVQAPGLPDLPSARLRKMGVNQLGIGEAYS